MGSATESGVNMIGRLRSVLYWFSLIILGGCAFSSSMPKTNHNVSAQRTDGFDIGYGTSFMMFDACGDTEFGRWYREDIIDKVEACPLTPAQKLSFYRTAALNADDALSGLLDFYATHSYPVKGHPSGIDISCEAVDKPEWKALRTKLSEYHSGKVKRPEVTPTECREGVEQGAP